MPISVNMFGERLTIDAHIRSKNGQPAHQTTGVARANAIRLAARMFTRPPRPGPSTMSLIASTKTGRVSSPAITNLRVMSASSGFGPSSSDTVFGSSAMPQIGHDPGPICTISGCIGHVYSTFAEVGEVGTVAAVGAGGFRYRAGSVSNLVLQPLPQK